jgi:hypothetical protein
VNRLGQLATASTWTSTLEHALWDTSKWPFQGDLASGFSTAGKRGSRLCPEPAVATAHSRGWRRSGAYHWLPRICERAARSTARDLLHVEEVMVCFSQCAPLDKIGAEQAFLLVKPGGFAAARPD